VKPAVCSLTASVFDNGLYEKSLCYVRIEANYVKAKALCSKNGMQLYQLKSSFIASSVISSFVKKAFGGSRKAVAYVDGSDGKKCSTFSGSGKRNNDWCKTSYTFFCEFNNKGNKISQSRF
jgi:hypothetical protein